MFDRIKSIISGVVVKGSFGTWLFPNSLKGVFLFNLLELENRDKVFYSNSKRLFANLNLTTFQSSWITEISTKEFYRRVSKFISPLSVTGAFGFGGRFNIGTSQYHTIDEKEFGKLVKPKTSLYVSLDMITVRKEYGDYEMPASTAITYKLTKKIKKPFRLVDVDLVINDLKPFILDIENLLYGGYIGSSYVDVKNIIPSQIFAHWLLKQAGDKVDGLIFSSQANSSGKNICLYLKDDDHCKRIFKKTKHKTK